MNAYTYLAIAICAEVIATASMKAVKGLSTPLPLLLMVVGYGIAFWMLILVVRTIPVGIAYAEASQSCYQKEFTSLLEQRKSGAINDVEGRKRLAEIIAGLNESNNLITSVNGKAGENLSNYTQAYEADLKNVGVERAEVTTVAKAPANKPVKQTKVPTEAVSTERVLQQAEAKQSKSQQVAVAGSNQVNSMCSNPDMGDWAPIPCPNV